MNTDIPFDSTRIPASFARCFQGDCPKAGACVRFLAGKHVPAGKLSGPAVYPTARRGDDCELYKPTRVIRAAYGFTALFAEVKRKDDTPLRDRLKAYLGGNTTYYRYHTASGCSRPSSRSGFSPSSAGKATRRDCASMAIRNCTISARVYDHRLGASLPPSGSVTPSVW